MELKNGRLRVTFAEPGTVHNQRFDNTAMVTQVVLDGKYPFCTREQVLPERRTTNGRGLCGEFVLPGAAESAKAGEWFCKPGVGWLKQYADGACCDMWHGYEVRAFETEAEIHENSILFCQKGTVSGGYGVDIEKRFTLEENHLILDISARNIGEKSIELQEYQHNFLSIEGLPAGDGYILELPCDENIAAIESGTLRQGDEIVLPSAVAVTGSKICWKSDLNGKVLYHRSEDIDPAAPCWWKLSHRDSKVSVMEETDFVPSRVDLWAVEHCVCAEFYHAAVIAPGENASWRRTWTFEGK